MIFFGAKKRKIVTPIQEQNPNTLFREHILRKTNASNLLVTEYDTIERKKPTSFWKRDLIIPRWLLLTLVSIAVILFAAFALFTAIVTLKKETNEGPCKTNSDCRQDLGLICNNYRCGCAYSHFWSGEYFLCERRRMINRTCTNDSMCDSMAELKCQNVTQSNGNIESQCQCEASTTWNGVKCGPQGIYNDPCLMDANCDYSRFLFCNLTLQLCRCNTSMFWNGDLTLKAGTCEYKRTVGQYCYPYDDNWCDDIAPIGQGLHCTQYSNPYESAYGICQCTTNEFYNGSALLANGFCIPHHVYNESCTSTSNCDYRRNLTCLNNLCLCAPGKNYDSTIVSNGVTGVFTSQNLYCDFSYYGGANTTGICLCNNSWSYWDGLICTRKLSVGGECSNNTQCISSDGLFCSNYSQSIGTCDCDKNHYWNNTCVQKKWFNESCSTSYICDDNRGLQCQGTGGALFEKCDCYNISFIWDSLYVTNRSQTCIKKLTNDQSTCYGDLECEDFNYLVCTNGTCKCEYIDYWDGSRCQAKRNYTNPCDNTTQCRDFSPVDLICRPGPTASNALQCLCSLTSYWEDCLQACVVSKKRHQPCTLVSNCSSNECDQTANLQCLNDSISNQTASGWCNCTSLQWWNGTYCRDKGIPAWGNNASAICNATYQCADYNLVSCPLASTCECATTKYWNGVTCLDRVIVNESCTWWQNSPVNTTTCLSAAGAGLLCNSSSCTLGVCTGGFCYCPSGKNWNSIFRICV
ncbi:hypothetical protein I4U23_018854 [Adineta vaga]|nr:hypothetical protein I4U23_018854 [Adineta vaga]